MDDWNDFNNEGSTDWSHSDWSSLHDSSSQMWDLSSQLESMSSDAWVIDDTEAASALHQQSEYAEWLSSEFEAASQAAYEWDPSFGPQIDPYYTPYESSIGYSSYDTSFIEPASSASSFSMISDNNASSML